MKRIVYILSVLFSLWACENSRTCKIEGRLSGLNSTTLYAIYESSEGNRIDTLACDEKGDFAVFHEQDDNLQAITFYYNDREEWFTVYPEAGKTIQVKGDAKYPQLIRIKGSEINDKLSEFKKKAETILRERADIINSMNENQLSNGEGPPQLANLDLALKRLAQDFITKNPKEKASVILISEYFMHPEEMEQTENLLDLISSELTDYYMLKDLKARITKAKTTMAGAKAPAFNVTDIYGQTITPDSFLNKYYVLAFTALWCDMCRTEVMMLDHIAAEYPKDSLEILLISLDDETDDVRDRILQDSVQWNLVTDSAGQAIDLFEKYNVNSLPECFLMDKSGIIKLRTSNGVELKQIIDEVMK